MKEGKGFKDWQFNSYLEFSYGDRILSEAGFWRFPRCCKYGKCLQVCKVRSWASKAAYAPTGSGASGDCGNQLVRCRACPFCCLLDNVGGIM
jgi:hypothetical protein